MLRMIFDPGMIESHVIGDEVKHEPQAALPEPLTQPGESGIPAKVGVHSVDLIINITDLANFKPVLRRGVSQHRELHNSFDEMLKSVQAL